MNKSKTEVTEVVNTQVIDKSKTEFTDTSKTIKTEISSDDQIVINEFEIKKDTSGKFVSVLKKQIIRSKKNAVNKTSENKAISETKTNNVVFTQESKKDSISAIKQSNSVKKSADLYLYVFLIVGLLCFGGWIWWKLK